MSEKTSRATGLPRLLFRAFLVAVGGWLAVSLALNRVEIASRRQELQDVQAQLEAQRQQNEELTRVLESGSDQEIIERVARDKLGYAEPGERVFIDVTGQ